MKSGLEDRNNQQYGSLHVGARSVSMKSGLEDRNNRSDLKTYSTERPVSMKSGLEGRNNMASSRLGPVTRCSRLNEARPRRPEQSGSVQAVREGPGGGLNEVRPRRPEQFRGFGGMIQAEIWSQ